jgi:phosphoribosylanthranilate isomerase
MNPTRREIARPRVKFCGMTRREDAVMAADLGADAVGFVFWMKSPRAVTPDHARDIVRGLPKALDKVGVFVDEEPETVAAVASHVGLTAVQLHGDESYDETHFDGLATIKAISASEQPSYHAAEYEAGRWDDAVTLLIDAFDRERRGGTGRRADWGFARALSAMRPVLLAGGISPSTVIEAIHSVLPFGLDVSSGVETSPGVKDHQRMRDLLAAAEHGWACLQMSCDEQWRARVQFRDAAPYGLQRLGHRSVEILR